MHIASPSRASSVISGPVMSPMLPFDLLDDPVRDRGVGGGQLAGLAHQGVAGAVLLPAAAVAARAAVAAGHDLHMAEFAGDAVLAALDLAVLQDRAADAGAERDHDEVVLAAARRRSATRAQAAVLASLSTMTGTARPPARRSRSGSLRQDRCGAKRTRLRSASTQPAAPMPTRVHVVPVGQVEDQFDDGVLDDLGALGLVRRLGAHRLQDVAVGVHDARHHLGAADVDADGGHPGRRQMGPALPGADGAQDGGPRGTGRGAPCSRTSGAESSGEGEVAVGAHRADCASRAPKAAWRTRPLSQDIVIRIIAHRHAVETGS